MYRLKIKLNAASLTLRPLSVFPDSQIKYSNTKYNLKSLRCLLLNELIQIENEYYLIM